MLYGQLTKAMNYKIENKIISSLNFLIIIMKLTHWDKECPELRKHTELVYIYK